MCDDVCELCKAVSFFKVIVFYMKCSSGLQSTPSYRPKALNVSLTIKHRAGF